MPGRYFLDPVGSCPVVRVPQGAYAQHTPHPRGLGPNGVQAEYFCSTAMTSTKENRDDNFDMFTCSVC